ncbi:MAG: guanylate kinase [Lachnospiraceae bacterium]|nr:guanylate kinase [Lachnospiraceae bacterium]
MGKIFCLMGKSSSGKDTIYKMLSEQEEISFSKIIPYTTRPMRQGEQEGVEYHFTSEERLSELTAQGKVIEVRAYDTVYGIWKYFTVDDGQIDLTSHDYLVIGTLEVYLALRGYYGKNVVVPIYIEVDDGLRLQRALDRERMQDTPKYAEMCRRFLADEKDFSEEKLREAEITTRFTNEELHVTVSDILRYIRRMR